MNISHKKIASAIVAAASVYLGQVVFAGEDVGTLNQAVTEAVLNNPEVSASWYEYEAAREEQRVAEGGYYPKLDLIAEIGHERKDDPGLSTNGYSRDSTRLTLSQMLFDGFKTRSEVRRLGHAKVARYFQLKEVSERIALEATQAYLDVLRYQKLVKLAEENYLEHRYIFDQIQERVTAGISRRVDLEQANGRLALAESNLLTEVTNLHDVTTTFQRVVGYLPAKELQSPQIAANSIPQTRSETLNQAYSSNPSLIIALEELRASNAAWKGRSAEMMPRFDLRFRQELDHDRDGVEGNFEENAIELVMTYNLYNGGADSARKRQFYQQMNSAQERRNTACRNVRQTVMIAYNNIDSLTRQLVYLDRNQLAIGKARQAYQKQFDIGQRTLLDLLDTENEYFDSRRSLVNAQQNLLAAQAETLSSMGLLLKALEVEGQGSQSSERSAPMDDELEIIACPQEAPPLQEINKDALLSGLMKKDSRFQAPVTEPTTYRMGAEFESNSSVLNARYKNELKEVAGFMNQQQSLKGHIAGHTDSTGTEKYNEWLSQRRAENLRKALVEDYGVSATRLTAKGYGESKPIADNTTESGRQLNRRVELEVIPADR